MRFTQFSALFVFFMIFGLALSSPVSKTFYKRDNAVATILDTLNNTIEPILDQICRLIFFVWFPLTFLIASAISSNSTNDTSIAPLVHDLDIALYNASSAIRALEYPNETADDTVGMAAPIINVCTLALNF